MFINVCLIGSRFLTNKIAIANIFVMGSMVV